MRGLSIFANAVVVDVYKKAINDAFDQGSDHIKSLEIMPVRKHWLIWISMDNQYINLYKQIITQLQKQNIDISTPDFSRQIFIDIIASHL